MPARDWTDFLGVYYRPHLIVMDLGSPTDSASGQKRVKLVRRLLESLGSTADFAILLEEHEIKVAFECDSDAEAIARGSCCRTRRRRVGVQVDLRLRIERTATQNSLRTLIELVPRMRKLCMVPVGV